jgi:pseudaminic acid cytidylyltransferase
LNRPIAIVPARGGSRRIPGKNKRLLAGVPIVVRVIHVLRSTNEFSDILVSTDDSEIAGLAVLHGARVLGLRSAELSDDFTPTLPVVQDTIRRLEEADATTVQEVCVAYPAAALATPSDVAAGLALLRSPNTDAVLTAAEFPHPIQRAWVLDDEGHAHLAAPEYAATRSQDLPPRYYDAGQLYFGTRPYWMERETEERLERRLLVRPAWAAVDIDTEDDWARAEMAIRLLENGGPP